MPPNNNSTTKDALEQVFQSIEQGNALRDEKKYWEAATAYTQARQTLLTLSSSNETTSLPSAAETQQIRALYQVQARDYLHRARETLLEALKQEDAADQSLAVGQPTTHEQLQTNHDDESCLERVRLFAWLFAKEETETPIEEQESTLEDRLRALNANLPKELQSDDQRMQNLHKGLRGLGLSLPMSTTTKSHLLPVRTKSESDQVQDIMAQAKEEAHMEALYPVSDSKRVTQKESGDMTEQADQLMDNMLDAVEAAKGLPKDSKDDDEDSAAASSCHNDDNNDDNNAFTRSDLAYFQDRVNEAQACLAELNAMLDIDDDEEEDAGLLFDADTGKHALDSAVKYLLQVQKKWKQAKKRG